MEMFIKYYDKLVDLFIYVSKLVAAIPLKDITADKFQARLDVLTELEQEYVSFISNYINDVNTQAWFTLPIPNLFF